MQFLITAKAEFYTHVEASSLEEAEAKAKKDNNIKWHRTMNMPLVEIRAEESHEPSKV